MSRLRFACLAFLLAPPLGAAEQTGRPLLDLYGQGIRRTMQAFPVCPTCVPSNPRSSSWHVAILANGRASVSITQNAPADPAGSRAEAFLGPGDPELLALVREALVEARIGFATGDCSATAHFFFPVGSIESEDRLAFDWRLTWYGKGPRVAVIELPESAVEACEPALQRVVDRVVDYALSVRERAIPPPPPR